MLNTWYQTENLIKSGKLNIKEVFTHEFSLDEVEQAILPAKVGNYGKPIIRIS
jgi:threonine dehydrogenase-like Zn-dependent dehydrogenase